MVGVTTYRFCVARSPIKQLRRKPRHVRLGCHKDLLVDGATGAWEVEGQPGWSGAIELVPLGNSGEELTSFTAMSSTLCWLNAVELGSGGYAGQIFLNESQTPGRYDCAEQNVVWHTEELRG